MSRQVYILGTRSTPCPTCKSKGFNESLLGPDRCAFCDGTEGGNPPTVDDLAFELADMRAKLTALQSEGRRDAVPDRAEWVSFEELDRRIWRDFAAGWAGARRSTPRQSSDEEAAVRDSLASAWIDALHGVAVLRTSAQDHNGVGAKYKGPSGTTDGGGCMADGFC